VVMPLRIFPAHDPRSSKYSIAVTKNFRSSRILTFS
jgi:hypothetical protein